MGRHTSIITYHADGFLGLFFLREIKKKKIKKKSDFYYTGADKATLNCEI